MIWIQHRQDLYELANIRCPFSLLEGTGTFHRVICTVPPTVPVPTPLVPGGHKEMSILADQ
jgi:hypothetical protein